MEANFENNNTERGNNTPDTAACLKAFIRALGDLLKNLCTARLLILKDGQTRKDLPLIFVIGFGFICWRLTAIVAVLGLLTGHTYKLNMNTARS